MTPLEVIASLVRLGGLVVTLCGLWYSASGMRVVVSGRIHERRSSWEALKLGVPLLLTGLLLLFGGAWLANWAQLP